MQWNKKAAQYALVVCGCWAALGVAHASALQSLELFVKTVKTGRTAFTQVVTAPAKEGQVARVKKSTGLFAFTRPSKFVFFYTKPFEQSIIADGQTLWLYDVDLNQVTARKQAQALGASPAALIASAADLKALQADFTLTDAPDAAGLEWVQAVPKGKDAQVQSIRVGFRGQGSESSLEVLEIIDSFGQRSVLTFTRMERNVTLPSAQFQFTPPAGADVIWQ